MNYAIVKIKINHQLPNGCMKEIHVLEFHNPRGNQENPNVNPTQDIMGDGNLQKVGAYV